MAQQGYPNSQPLQVPANVYELMISHQLGRALAWYREKPRALPGGCLLAVGVFLELSLLPLLLFLSLSLSLSQTQISVATLLTPQGAGVALFFLLAVLFGFLIGRGGWRLLAGPFLSLRRGSGLPHRPPENRDAVGPDHERDSLTGKTPFRSQFGVSAPTKRWSRTQH